jgi:2-polyprenyl-3-methyl-5-hydroxy-6-metoxy-1,4-benzoquinol methylase
MVLGRNRQAIFTRYVALRPTDRVLDIGCGPGDALYSVPEGVTYEGFDLSEAYIAQARKRWGSRGTFRCERVDEASLESPASYDLVLSAGVLHHLEDSEALALFRVAALALKPGARLITIDPCLVPGQSPIARFIISKDRGQNVRDAEGYQRLARQVFGEVTPQVRHDLLRIPYTHLILQCRGPLPTSAA